MADKDDIERHEHPPERDPARPQRTKSRRVMGAGPGALALGGLVVVLVLGAAVWLFSDRSAATLGEEDVLEEAAPTADAVEAPAGEADSE